MSRQLVSHSPDLKRLQNEGYDIEIRSNFLLVKVPYVTASKAVAIGILISELTVSGNTTGAPNNHVVHFVGATDGEVPCDNHGHTLDDLINQAGQSPATVRSTVSMRRCLTCIRSSADTAADLLAPLWHR